MKKSSVALAVIGIAFAGGAAFFLSGSYNVSATDKHWDITTKVIELVRDRSVHAGSEDIVAPPLDNKEMIANGAKNYDAMCVQCHLAPGVEPTELSQALYPKPPIFYQDDGKHKHSPAETFWAIKNGFKMTGMPAWGEFHTDQQLWEMTAFLQELKTMDAETYKELVGEGGHTHAEGVHDKPEHDNSDGHHDKPEHDNSDGHHDKPEHDDTDKH